MNVWGRVGAGTVLSYTLEADETTTPDPDDSQVHVCDLRDQPFSPLYLFCALTSEDVFHTWHANDESLGPANETTYPTNGVESTQLVNHDTQSEQ